SFPLSEKFLPPLLLAIVVESLLYGMHTIIFFLCVRVLLQQKRRLRMIMLVAVVIMFMLATADLAITWNIILQHTQILYSGDSSKLLTAIYPKFIIFLINKSVPLPRRFRYRIKGPAHVQYISRLLADPLAPCPDLIVPTGNPLLCSLGKQKDYPVYRGFARNCRNRYVSPFVSENQ
ncbi:hypothetical protein BDZ97DRAFT_1851135, partial [Flammula alnicola]